MMSLNPDQHLSTLESLLVQEFRALQSLIAVTREERSCFTAHDPAALMLTVEKKEALLDELSLTEEARRMTTLDVTTGLGLPTRTSSLVELLPHLDSEISDRLGRLSDGISALVDQARDLNYGNRVLSRTALDWVVSTQAFLINTCQPESGYRPPGAIPSYEQTAVWDIEHQA